MKDKIHPKYDISRVSCSCGEVFTTRSTLPEIKVEVCSKCHPFYSGQQKFVDTGGRVEKFQKKYEKRLKEIQKKEEAARKEKEEKQMVEQTADGGQLTVEKKEKEEKQTAVEEEKQKQE